MPHCAECDCYISDQYVDRVGYATDDGEPLCAECSDTDVYRGTTATDGGRGDEDEDVVYGTVAELDAVCDQLEEIRSTVTHAAINRELQHAIGHAWAASILQRADENADVQIRKMSGWGGRDVE